MVGYSNTWDAWAGQEYRKATVLEFFKELNCTSFKYAPRLSLKKGNHIMTEMQPFFEDVQSHYDLSDDFFALFLDPTRTYSCAWFDDPNATLEEAQKAKIDLSLGKCELSPGMKLLDIGCGWGTTALRAAERYQVNAIGLTLSKNQFEHASQRARESGLSDTVQFRLQGWEEFSEPVDRIVSIGAFEHFRNSRHEEFFKRCSEILPPGGIMMLHTIVTPSLKDLRERGIEFCHEDIKFARFIRDEIFPGGQLCAPERVKLMAQQNGFDVYHVQALGLHYAHTLDCWSESLANAKQQAIALTSPTVYDRYQKYLTGCAEQFRKGVIDVMQFCMRRN
jgi:cyclopropane-fatty-acyl-phospholipid synthase